jgi:hypothetical protein
MLSVDDETFPDAFVLVEGTATIERRVTRRPRASRDVGRPGAPQPYS